MKSGRTPQERRYWLTIALKCPWCGHEEADSWEVPDGEDLEHECALCGGTFRYSTSRVFESWTEGEDDDDGR